MELTVCFICLEPNEECDVQEEDLIAASRKVLICQVSVGHPNSQVLSS